MHDVTREDNISKVHFLIFHTPDVCMLDDTCRVAASYIYTTTTAAPVHAVDHAEKKTAAWWLQAGRQADMQADRQADRQVSHADQ